MQKCAHVRMAGMSWVQGSDGGLGVHDVAEVHRRPGLEDAESLGRAQGPAV